MKRTIVSLPQRSSNATLSGGTKTEIAAAVWSGQSHGQRSPNLRSRQPQRERARRALAALFPDGPPDAADLPNKLLANQVNDWLEANKQLSSDSAPSSVRLGGHSRTNRTTANLSALSHLVPCKSHMAMRVTARRYGHG
jgi:hypothetical protein